MHNMLFAISVIAFINQPATEGENSMIEEAYGRSLTHPPLPSASTFIR
jgi:hypothetical protein